MRYALEVQYIGKGYAGSQIQFENGKQITEPTVQGELEKALSTLICVSRCENPKDLRNSKALKDETQQNHRCELDESKASKAISDCTGDKGLNNTRPIKTIFSGRTDKGVNSLGQVVHFDSDKDIVASKFVYQMNEILPRDISVSNLRCVPDSFHAQNQQ